VRCNCGILGASAPLPFDLAQMERRKDDRFSGIFAGRPQPAAQSA
jgi:hypothetical protein